MTFINVFDSSLLYFLRLQTKISANVQCVVLCLCLQSYMKASVQNTHSESITCSYFSLFLLCKWMWLCVYESSQGHMVSTDWPIKQLQLIEQKTEVHILDRNWDRTTVFIFQSMRAYQTLFFIFSIANLLIFCRNSSFLFICAAKIIFQWSTSNKTFQKLLSISCDLWAPVQLTEQTFYFC